MPRKPLHWGTFWCVLGFISFKTGRFLMFQSGQLRKDWERWWETAAVDVFTVECCIQGMRPFLGSNIMDRHETVKYEKGETVERGDSWERSEKDVRRQVRHGSRCLQSRMLYLQLKTFFGYCHHVQTWDSEIWERGDSRERRQLRKEWERGWETGETLQ